MHDRAAYSRLRGPGRVFALGLGFWLLVASPASAATDRPDFARDVVGGWVRAKSIQPGPMSLSREEAGSLSKKLQGIVEVFQALPSLNPPRGIHVRSSLQAALPAPLPAASDQPVTAKVIVALRAYVRDRETGTVWQSRREAPIEVAVNALPLGVPYAEDADGPMYLEPVVVGQLGGSSVYEGGVVHVTKIPRPLFLPVTQERFLLSQIAAAREGLRDYEGARAHGTPEGTWAEEKEEAIRVFEKSLRGVAKRDPAHAEELRADFLTRLNATESVKRQEGTYYHIDTQAGLESFTKRIRGLEQELASLSAEERTASAHIGGPTARASLLSDAGPEARRLVVPNPAFFDRSLGRTSLQSLSISVPQVNQRRFFRALLRIRSAIRDQLDYQQLQNLLEAS
jgi:hypothetical protein